MKNIKQIKINSIICFIRFLTLTKINYSQLNGIMRGIKYKAIRNRRSLENDRRNEIESKINQEILFQNFFILILDFYEKKQQK